MLCLSLTTFLCGLHNYYAHVHDDGHGVHNSSLLISHAACFLICCPPPFSFPPFSLSPHLSFFFFNFFSSISPDPTPLLLSSFFFFPVVFGFIHFCVYNSQFCFWIDICLFSFSNDELFDFISIFSLLLFFLSFLYNCTGSAFLFLCDLGLHLETWSLSTWKSKPLVGVTTLQEEEGNRTPKEAVTHHLLSLHITLKWTGNRHEESP